MSAILKIHVKFDVTRLIDEVDTTIRSLERTWTKSTNRPSTHTISTTAEIALLVWQNATIAIRVSNS